MCCSTRTILLCVVQATMLLQSLTHASIAVWTREHSVCSLDTTPQLGSSSDSTVYSLNSSIVSCREAPYMTYVRTHLERDKASKGGAANDYKHQVLDAISKLYSDLEINRKPFMIDLSAGKGRTIGIVNSTTEELPAKHILLHPISFCIPEENLITTIPSKIKSFGSVIPGKTSTYFPIEQESAYFADMQTSLFVLTFKKGGWDCYRHYEILAAGSLPLFLHVKHCPPQALVAHPKRLYQLLLHTPGLELQGIRSGLHTMDISKMNFNMDEKEYAKELYRVSVAAMLQYTRNVLTTSAMASYLLDTMVRYSRGRLLPAPTVVKNRGRPLSVFYLTHQDHDMDKGDYLTDFLLLGLKRLLGGEAVVDYPPREAIYQTHQEFNHTRYWKRRHELYGGGVSWGLKEDVLIDSDSRDRGRITDSIVNRKYDLIILGSGHRDGWASKLHFWDLVCKHYHPLEVAWIDGSDKPAPKRLLDKYSVCAGHMFSREGFAED